VAAVGVCVCMQACVHAHTRVYIHTRMRARVGVIVCVRVCAWERNQSLERRGRRLVIHRRHDREQLLVYQPPVAVLVRHLEHRSKVRLPVRFAARRVAARQRDWAAVLAGASTSGRGTLWLWPWPSARVGCARPGSLRAAPARSAGAASAPTPQQSMPPAAPSAIERITPTHGKQTNANRGNQTPTLKRRRGIPPAPSRCG
jgi:hypothetical protein